MNPPFLLSPASVRRCIAVMAVLAAGVASAQSIPNTAMPSVIISTATEPVADGEFQPTWESLKQYRVPEWFRDAKFGI